jgi:2'-5' RNA ligase
MNKPIYDFYVVSYLPEPFRTQVLTVAKKVSEQCNTFVFLDQWEPHITVGSGLWNVPHDQLENVFQGFGEAIKDLHQIPVHLTGLGSTDKIPSFIAKEPYAVWIEAEVTTELTNIFETTNSYAEWRVEEKNIKKYSPHATLAYDDFPEDAYKKAMELLQEESLEFTFPLEAISLVALNAETGKWEALKTYSLKK